MSGFQIKRDGKAYSPGDDMTIIVDVLGFIQIKGDDIKAHIGGRAWDRLVAGVEMLREENKKKRAPK